MGTSVILLAGGLGTRVRALYPDLPKPMIPARGKPFLEWVLGYWARQRVNHAVVSLGHLAEVAEGYLAGRARDGMAIEVVRESQPMGTGGAVVWAARHAAALSDPFFVANADSLVVADLAGALERMRRDPAVEGVVLGVEMEDASRYGSLEVDAGGRLLGFGEKRAGRGWINAGVYLFRRSLLERFPRGVPLSMETQVFPQLLGEGARIEVERVRAPFLDMGTPEALEEMEGFVKEYLGG